MAFESVRFEFESVIMKAVRDRIRDGKVKLLKGYIQLIGVFRTAALAAAGLAAVVSIFVAGLVLLIVALIALIPVSTETYFIIIGTFGGVMTLASGVILFGFFREKSWLKHAKVPELMDMVLNNKPFEHPFSEFIPQSTHSKSHASSPIASQNPNTHP